MRTAVMLLLLLAAPVAQGPVRSEPSGPDFMYQILLTAVNALVTALVWKAVF